MSADSGGLSLLDDVLTSSSIDEDVALAAATVESVSVESSDDPVRANASPDPTMATTITAKTGMLGIRMI